MATSTLQEGKAFAAKPRLCEAAAQRLERLEESGYASALPQRDI